MVPVEWRLSAARRLLVENGYGDLLLSAPVEPLPPEPEPPQLVDILLERRPVEPEPINLRVRGSRIYGEDGSTRLTAALRLLLRAIAASPEPVEHGYTVKSAERLLRAARMDLRCIDVIGAQTVGVPVVEGSRVWVPMNWRVRLTVAGLDGFTVD